MRFAEFYSDYAVRDGQVYKRSNEIGEPAAHMVVTRKSSGQAFDVWFPQLDEIADNSKAPYLLQPKELKWEHFTGFRFHTSQDSTVSGAASCCLASASLSFST